MAQAIRLPGPASAAIVMAQPIVMEAIMQQPVETTPIIRVRQSLITDICPPEPESILKRLPFVFSDIPNLGV